MEIIPVVKVCPRCQAEKPIANFAKNTRYRDGFTNICMKCHNEYPGRKEYKLQWQRNYRKEHPEEMRSRYQERYWKNPEKARAAAKQLRQQLKYEVMGHYSGGMPHCACCGETQLEFLCIDHIEGGGKKHIAQIGFGTICRWLKANSYPDGFRVLCFNCNNALSLFGFCPHQESEVRVG